MLGVLWSPLRRAMLGASRFACSIGFQERHRELRGRMNDKIGIWIDHKQAVIVSTSADRVTAKTVESEVGPHARYSGRAGYPTSEGPRTEEARKNTRNDTISILTGTTTKSSVSWVNPRLFSSSGRVRPSCNSRSVSAAPRRCLSILSELRPRTS